MYILYSIMQLDNNIEETELRSLSAKIITTDDDQMKPPFSIQGFNMLSFRN